MTRSRTHDETVGERVGASLAIRNLTARYDRTQVLHGVDLDLVPGQVGVLLGANGAGKTTLLRAISGLVTTGGTIEIDGVDIAGKEPDAVARAGVGHVPQGRGTFPDLTVAENLRLGGYLLGAAEAAVEIDRWLTRFPRLAERSNQAAGLLSGGEQQMLAIARALVNRPRLLLLDEPSLGLAPMIVAEVFSIIEEVNAEFGVTTLVVEQNASSALKVASSALVLESGSVVLRGTPAEIQSSPDVIAAYLGYR
jgi:branched-chain amino acid transport system ATP-binding protein